MDKQEGVPLTKNDFIDSYEKSKMQSLLDERSSSNHLTDEEKHLNRSRSEHDLKDLLHQSLKVEDPEKVEDSFLEAYPINPVAKKENEDIKIQENLFEDSSRLSSNHNPH